MSEFTLTSEQQSLYDLCENTDKNYLIHGKPGVGKSVLIRALRETGKKNWAVAAPTGLAALNIGGKTLHSTFGIVPSDGIYEPDFNLFTKNEHVHANVYYRIQHLIIDEVSMVRADLLDYIDRELRHIKGIDLPFGGIQVVVVGDFFQLPPITSDKDKKALKENGWASQFAFHAASFTSFTSTGLSKVLRQADEVFIGILHAARTGKLSGAQLKLLNKQVGKPNDFRPTLVAVNKQADLINLKQLSLIKEQPQKFIASKYGWWPALPVDEEITLKVGAHVMIKKNNADKAPGFGPGVLPASGRIVNGTICKISKLPSTEDGPLEIELEDGTKLPIYKAKWERKEKTKIAESWSEKVVSWYEQYPVQLAWAISMHKSQGQSFDKIHIDPSRVFEAGQLYVALSRCRTLAGISLQTPINEKDFKVNEDVIRFNTWLEKTLTAPASKVSVSKQAKKKS